MPATLSFGGQVSLLNDHIESLNEWLTDEEIDMEFGQVFILGETTESGIAEVVSDHLEKLKRFERRLTRNHDVGEQELAKYTNPVRFDLKRMSSLFLSS